MQTANFFAPGFDEQVEQQNIERQRKMAELLRQQSAQGIGDGRMVGRHYVAPHWLEGVAQMLQAGSARRMDEQATDQQRKLAEAVRGKREAEWSKITPMLTGREADAPLGEGIAGPVRDAEPINQRGAYTLAMQSSDPALRQFGFQGMAQLPQFEEQRKNRQEDVQWREKESVARRDEAARAAEIAHQRHLEVLNYTQAGAEKVAEANRAHAENMARLQREHSERMARLQASLQPRNQQIVQTAEGMGTVVGGKFVPITDASGKPVRGPKDPAAEAGKASQLASFDTMLDSLSRLKEHPGLSRSVGVNSYFPTIRGTNAADFEAQLETFKAQAFIPMVAQLKGMGALSNAEGEKLSAAVGALDPKMGEKAFRESIDRIMAEMNAARARVGGVSQSGAPSGMQMPPADAIAAEIERRRRASQGTGGAPSIGGE